MIMITKSEEEYIMEGSDRAELAHENAQRHRQIFLSR
jgi:hypothetical protein